MAIRSVFLRLAFAMCVITLLASAANACPPGYVWAPGGVCLPAIIVECGSAEDPCPPPNQGQCPVNPPPPCSEETGGCNQPPPDQECEAVPVGRDKDGKVTRQWVPKTRRRG